MRIVPILSLICCTACAPAYDVYAPEVYLPARFQNDKVQCVADAKGYPHALDLGGAAVSGAQGAANNLSEIPINPVIPLAGAAGGAGSSLLSTLDLFGDVERRAYVQCLEKKTDKDESALVLNVE